MLDQRQLRYMVGNAIIADCEYCLLFQISESQSFNERYSVPRDHIVECRATDALEAQQLIRAAQPLNQISAGIDNHIHVYQVSGLFVEPVGCRLKFHSYPDCYRLLSDDDAHGIHNDPHEEVRNYQRDRSFSCDEKGVISK